MSRRRRIALVGNPNAGKTTLFNRLTGLKQRTGNYPGVTVERRVGRMHLDGEEVDLVDLPGTYSIYPTTFDESMVIDELSRRDDVDRVVLVVDVQSLERNLLLFSQVYDLGIPVVLALNMYDRREADHDVDALSRELGVPVIPVSARTGEGLDELRAALDAAPPRPFRPFYELNAISRYAIEGLVDRWEGESDYALWHRMVRSIRENPFAFGDAHLSTHQVAEAGLSVDVIKKEETHKRYERIREILETVATARRPRISRTDLVDRFILHPVLGYVIFLAILLVVFQAVFAWATAPMDAIDGWFAQLSVWVQDMLPPGPVADLLTEGVLAGIGGVVIFVPQIAFLFLFISLLEQTGYMTRVIFLMDRIMRPLGLSGRSVVPLMSGVACAIPAILSARAIGNTRERLITVFVTPFMTCSARLPVYTILIALVVPADARLLGIRAQGLALMGLYLLGVVAAVATAWVMKRLLHTGERSILAMEMPRYRLPSMRTTFITLYDKSRTFVVEAGRIILAISIVLWFLSSYGVGEGFHEAETIVAERTASMDLTPDEVQARVSAQRLEHSFAGRMGHAIEPVIRPLGYDWRIGIALVTSFAAREVFVGSMATMFSIGEDFDDPTTIRDRMRTQVDERTGRPLFDAATSISLLLFYAFAMQCMSTFAVVRRETNSWRWPFIQLGFMTAVAYVSALIAYQWLS